MVFVIIYLFAQKTFVRSITAGAVKDIGKMEKTNRSLKFEETFKNPGKEFRGTPFLVVRIQNYAQIVWKSRSRSLKDEDGRLTYAHPCWAGYRVYGRRKNMDCVKEGCGDREEKIYTAVCMR